MTRFLKIVIPIVILCLSGGVYAALVSLKKQPEQHIMEKKPLPVDVLRIKRKDVVLFVETSGTVQPLHEIELVSAVQGQINFTDRRLLAGGFFRAGEEILNIDDTIYQAAVASAQAELAQAELGLARMEASASQARRDWKRLGSGEGSPLTLFEPQLNEAKALVGAATTQLKVAQLDLRRTQLVAPFDCKIRKHHIALGQHVQVGVPLATIFSVEAAEVRLPVRSEDLAKFGGNLLRTNFADNQQLPVELSGVIGGIKHVWNGSIVRSEGVIDPSSRRVYMVARVEDPYGFNNTDRPVLPVGLYVQARIRGHNLKNIISIPEYALRGNNNVLLVDNDNRLRLKKVQILHRNGNSLLLKSGIQSGERLCLTSLDYVIEGVRVDVAENLVAGGSNE